MDVTITIRDEDRVDVASALETKARLLKGIVEAIHPEDGDRSRDHSRAFLRDLSDRYARIKDLAYRVWPKGRDPDEIY